jgi:hypothetical protein
MQKSVMPYSTWALDAKMKTNANIQHVNMYKVSSKGIKQFASEKCLRKQHKCQRG